MIRHDLSRWPLVITVEQGPASLTDMQAYIEEWRRWLARGESFVTLRVFADAEALVHPPGSAPLAKQWLNQQGEAIRQLVMGMATVVPPSGYERLRKMNAEKLFGVPAATFADVAGALGWLKEHVYEPLGLVLNARAMGATIEALLTVKR
ncbi:hypothetical protein CAP48_11485 [Advenella sp. S44]|uniref:hypothetical protein n=1 Tax=Advenella sp. S44 TaxID=1982755 RepID=UPI000C2A28D1|nr:hypothetical protein [Advenella sp. S44]PJX24119.1 hypothetical protein CAP48_11485 [Advenella sp. S44]